MKKKGGAQQSVYAHAGYAPARHIRRPFLRNLPTVGSAGTGKHRRYAHRCHALLRTPFRPKGRKGALRRTGHQRSFQRLRFSKIFSPSAKPISENLRFGTPPMLDRWQQLKKQKMKYCTILLYLFAFSLTQAQDISRRVTEYASSYVNTGDFSGCVLITENGKNIYENCFGFANQSFQISNEKHTKFKIGSISKQFTAAAILILEQDGLLSSTDSLAKFFPNNTRAENITIQQLLTHTSGITDIYNIPDFNKLSCQKRNISELSDLVLAAELNFEPGSQYQYSNGGYAILADIIEKVSGKSYQEYLAERIFKPLEMNSTGHHKGNAVVTNLAVGYDPLGYDNVKITDFLDPELLKGSGSLYSTVHDMQIWINSIKDKSFLTKESYDKFLTNYGNNYGFGISIYKSFGQEVFGHDGRVNGYIADYLHYRESELSITILGNIQTGVADFFRRDIAAIVFDKEYKSRAKTALPETKNVADKQAILGTYSFGPNFKVYVEEIDSFIQARANEGGSSELVLLKDGKFFNRTLYSYIDFVENENGEVTKMIWTNNDGNSFEGTKE